MDETMKTLYISDLDGTLLNPEALLSSSAAERLNELLAKGLVFSVATARTAATAADLVKPLNLSLPIILMNGVAVYDTKTKTYVKEHPMTRETVQEVFKILEKFNTPGFVYSIVDHKLMCYEPPKLNARMAAFMEERKRDYGKVFTPISSYDATKDKDVIYFTVIDEEKALAKTYEAVRKLPGVNALFYEDIYNDGYFLEIYAKGVSKGQAALWLKQEARADRLAVFGDNLNDLPMMELADFSYATANAKTKVKEMADLVIGPNSEDSVVGVLEKAMAFGS
jgi:Cof subfamily protein (haloacid dehalogenase superfamily)